MFVRAVDLFFFAFFPAHEMRTPPPSESVQYRQYFDMDKFVKKVKVGINITDERIPKIGFPDRFYRANSTGGWLERRSRSREL
jgi:hypothetical protein